MRKFTLYFSFFILVIIIFSCNKFQNKYEGKHFVIPTSTVWTYYGQDTIKEQVNTQRFTIIKYVDSTGCFPCKLNYQRLVAFIQEMNANKHLVDLKIIINTKDIQKAIHVSKTENIAYPICIDSLSRFERSNIFLKGQSVHTLLLDAKNNILYEGDPSTSKVLHDTYKKLILGNKYEEKSKTFAEISNRNIYFGKINKGEIKKEELFIENHGILPLVINDIVSSCGCLNIVFEKKVVLPHQKTKCQIYIKTNNDGYFSKTVLILSNSKNPLYFKVTGYVKSTL